MVPRCDTAFPVWVGALKFRLAIIVTVFELLILVGVAAMPACINNCLCFVLLWLMASFGSITKFTKAFREWRFMS